MLGTFLACPFMRMPYSEINGLTHPSTWIADVGAVTEREASMSRKGDMSERDGYYRATCCNRERAIRRGEKFPSCKTCKKLTRWTFIRPLNHIEAPRPGSSPRHHARPLS